MKTRFRFGAAVIAAGLLLCSGLGNQAQVGEIKEAYPVIHAETIEYADGDTTCDGFIAWDTRRAGPRPAVLIVHDWMGRGAFDEQRARELAALGYVGFSVDVFGKGVRPANTDEARRNAGRWYADGQALRTRLNAALKAVRGHEMVDASRIAAIGYCFGGSCVLEMARSGADLRGVVSFHGGLRALAERKEIKARVLVLHGADDPIVPDEQVAAFWAEMRESDADWQFVAYGDAVHSFTKPAAGDDKSRGSAYNQLADGRSWRAMKDFLTEVFGR